MSSFDLQPTTKVSGYKEVLVPSMDQLYLVGKLIQDMFRLVEIIHINLFRYNKKTLYSHNYYRIHLLNSSQIIVSKMEQTREIHRIR